jgi:hypothetical protein
MLDNAVCIDTYNSTCVFALNITLLLLQESAPVSSSSRGTAAVLERPSPVVDDELLSSSSSEAAQPEPVEEVKLVSAADVERLRRMFGSA